MDTHDSGAEKLASKGMALIAAYRAARIAGRPALRRELQLARARMREELGRGSRIIGGPLEEATDEPMTAEVVFEPLADSGEQAGAGSVFAGLVDAAQPRPEPEGPIAIEAPAPQPEAGIDAAGFKSIGESPEHAAGVAPPGAPPVPPEEASAEAKPPPGLEVLGLGPGMLIRLGQLGIHNAADLATSEAASVRGSLGDISRLINVESWIDRARAVCG